jgi:hypothetical protein
MAVFDLRVAPVSQWLEADAKEQGFTSTDLAAYRQEHAGPALQCFVDWLAQEVPRVLPKSRIGEAIGYAANQWPTLVRYAEDGRLTIDNSPAEQAIRPLAVGRRNWLQIAGDGGLRSAAVLLSVAASAKRHGVNPWAYLTQALTQLPARRPGADLTDLLPDGRTCARFGTLMGAGRDSQPPAIGIGDGPTTHPRGL